MDKNIGFDPNNFSNEEKMKLKARLDDGEDPDGCKVFKLKARKNDKKKKYMSPEWKMGSNIAQYFGNIAIKRHFLVKPVIFKVFFSTKQPHECFCVWCQMKGIFLEIYFTQ